MTCRQRAQVVGPGILTALHRLKRRIGMERGRCARFYKAASTTSSRDRAYYEMTMCDLAMGFVDVEIRRAKETP